MSPHLPFSHAPRRQWARQPHLAVTVAVGLLIAFASTPATAVPPELRVSMNATNTGLQVNPNQSYSFTDLSGLPYIVGAVRRSGSSSAGECGTGGTAAAGGVAAPGYLRVSASASGFAQCSGAVRSRASAFYEGSFQVTGGVGFLGVRDFTWDLIHTLGVPNASVVGPSGAVNASLQAFIRLDDGVQSQSFSFTAMAQLTDDGFVFFDDIPDSFTVPWNLFAGRTIVKTVSISASTFIEDDGIFVTGEPGTQAQGSAIAAFPTSLHWQGFDLLPGESVIGSTVDWSLAAPVVTVPIPEPGTWALLLAGLGVVAGHAARSRRSRGRRPAGATRV